MICVLRSMCDMRTRRADRTSHPIRLGAVSLVSMVAILGWTAAVWGATPIAGFDKALDCVSTDDTELRTAENIYIDDAWTMELWFKVSTAQNNTFIGGLYEENGGGQSIWNAATIQIDSASLRLTYRGVPSDSGGINIEPAINYVDGTWHHFAATFDGDTLTLYMDGAYVAEATDSAPAFARHLHMFLGSNGTSEPYENYDGLVDDVRLWNICRTAEEIAAYHKIPLSGTEAGLIAYWTFDDSNDNAVDKTGNGHTMVRQMGSTSFPNSGIASELIANEDTRWVVPLAGHDADGDALTARITSFPSEGKLYQVVGGSKGSELTAGSPNVSDANEQIYYVPDPNWNGSDSFAYVLNDGSTDSSARTVTTTIASVNDAPIAGYGTALDFDGVNDLVNIGDVLEGFSACTFEAWIYYRAPSNENYLEICTKEHINSFALHSANPGSSDPRPVHFNLGDGTGWYTGQNSSLTLATDTWHHVAVSWDWATDTAKLFLNGNLEETWSPGATNAPTANTNRDRYIGAKIDEYGPLGFFNGRIDELRIWTTARTDQEVADDRYRTLDGTEAGLAGYWHFNDGANDLLDDLSNNDYNGVLTNMDTGSDWVSSGGTVEHASVEDTALTNYVPATDVDRDALTFSVVSNATNGTVVFDDAAAGIFTYTPDADFNGSDSFTYRVNDGNGDSNTATVNLTVAGKPDVTAVTPTAGSVNVAGDSDVTVKFDEAIDNATLTAGSIYLYGSLSGVQKPVPAWNGGTDTATLDPAEDFQAGELITVMVTNSVLSSGGVPVTPYVWQFHVASQTAPVAFEPAMSVAVSYTTAGCIDAGDIDDDGDIDLVSGTEVGVNEWFTNNGSNAPFNSVSPMTASEPTNWPTDLFLADIDGDGDLDILASDTMTTNVYTPNNGTADSFNAFSDVNITNDTDDTLRLAAADLDGDGDLDVVAGNRDETNRLYLNNGTNDPFNGVSGSNISSDTNATYDVALIDVDHDGDMDLICANSGVTNKLYLNNGTTNPFNGVSGIAVSAEVNDSRTLAVGDINGDGLPDLVVGNAGSVNRYYLNNGTADPFNGATSNTVGADTDDTRDIHLADMNGDGRLDIVAINHGQVNRVYLNNGTATPFTGVTGISITSDADDTPQGVVADFNGDGVLDVAVSVDGAADKVYLSVTLPTVTTTGASNVAATTTDSGGNVTSDGGGTISARGVCWSTSTSPDINDNTTSSGTGAGAFTSNLTGLSPNTTYYYRAYATNAAGTSYGNELSFTTPFAMPTVTTTAISGVTTSAAQSGGDVTDDGGDGSVARGVCWNTSGSPTVADSTTSDGSGSGTFTSALTGLSPNTTYYVRAYATNGAGTSYGNEMNFTTSIAMPSVTTTAVSGVTSGSAQSGGNVTDDGGDGSVARGVCWNTTGSPTVADSKADNGTGSGAFASTVSGLSPNTTYYVRAYATNGAGTVYGNELTFTTPIALPSLTTTAISGITTNGAQSGGNVTNDGGDGSVARGICWNTSGSPTIADDKTDDGTGAGSYTSTLSDLSPNTTYYVRAYATNGAGTQYGNELSFSTQVAGSVVTTAAISDVTPNSARAGGDVTGAGGGVISARGICWNTAGTPTTTDSITSDGTGTGAFVSVMSGLTPNTTYYIRAYATNESGTAYGNEVSFTTGIAAPSVTTTAVTGITASDAMSGGEVTDAGGDSVTARGVCWNTTGAPDISDNTTGDGTGIGTFTSALSELSPNTTYYIRAYATNSAGTGYGTQRSFTTDLALPDVTTAGVSDVEPTSAGSGGDITDDGGDSIFQRGVCWNTSGNPTIADFSTDDGAGVGAFSSAITGLVPDTTYYLRAYATNSLGTSYGDEVSFTTSVALPEVTTKAVFDVTSDSAVVVGQVDADGGSAVTARGMCWNTTGSPTISDDKTSDGTGVGSFTSRLTGIAAHQTYYVRAYATNSAGTAYGSERMFTTGAALPVVTTTGVSEVTMTTAVSGGEVVSDGGSDVTERGVCWNTSGSPTTTDSKTTDGTGTGLFVSMLENLTADTTYYVRAFATNTAGTAYGNAISFTTTAPQAEDPPAEEEPEEPPTAPNLQVKIQAEVEDADVGQQLGFRVDVENIGNGDATSVVLRFPLPVGTDFIGAWLMEEEAAQALPLTAYVEGNEIVVELGNVRAAEARDIQLVLSARASGTVTLDAQLSSAEEPTPTTAQASSNVEVDDVYWEIVEITKPVVPCGGMGIVSPLICTLSFWLLRRRP